MSTRRPPRRHSWNRSQSEGFGPIRQVGIAFSVGLPLMVVGLFLVAIGSTAEMTFLWILGGCLLLAGVLASASGRIT